MYVKIAKHPIQNQWKPTERRLSDDLLLWKVGVFCYISVGKTSEVKLTLVGFAPPPARLFISIYFIHPLMWPPHHHPLHFPLYMIITRLPWGSIRTGILSLTVVVKLHAGKLHNQPCSPRGANIRSNPGRELIPHLQTRLGGSEAVRTELQTVGKTLFLTVFVSVQNQGYIPNNHIGSAQVSFGGKQSSYISPLLK